MRTFLRSKVTLLFMTLGMLIAVPAVALAAELDTDAVLSSNVAAPTYVKVGDNSFQIKVWATGNIASSQTGAAQVVNKYNMSTSGSITADSAATSKTALDFLEGKNYSPGQDCPLNSPANQGTGMQGCVTNPFVVNSTLNVAAGTAHDKTGVLTVSHTGSNGLTPDTTPDAGSVKVDAAGPTITLNPPDEGDSYDVGDSVIVDYSCSDSGSGVKATGGCVGTLADGATLDTSTPGSYSFTVNAEDKLENKSSVTHNYTVVNPDDVAPTSSATATIPDSDDAGTDPDSYSTGTWTNQNVTVTLSGQDNQGGSGLKEIRYTLDGTEPTKTTGTVYSTPFTVSSTTTVKYLAVDNNGNAESPVNSFQVNIDKDAPAPNCGSASSSWLGTNASIACNPTDSGGSGLASTTPASFNLVTNVADDAEDANASTDSRTISDAAGNTATAGPITGNKIDRKDPSLLCDAPDGLWHASNVSLGCTASDSGSGLASAGDASFSLSTSVIAGTETDNASTGSRSVVDAVGNSATAGPISGNMIDMKIPGITLTTPAANATYTLGQVVNAAYNCTDLGSLIATCLGTNDGSPVNNDSPINTSTIGTHNFQVDAADNVGNTSNVSRNYSVAAAFNGFFQPIDGNLVNTGKTGRVYPVKWQLSDASGALLSDADAQALVSSMTVKQSTANCDSGVSDALETEAGAAGSTSVRYDAASDQFIYNYKAPSTLGCYTLSIHKADGINTKSILFKFTK